ncbi:transglycosylase SLT domain-containing protein [Aestuariivirga sp.]|uniref:transglycosylase SLT domain-containing protein n=1 Tax=Aestuariivirga sp. TaxID=2650926 RepID=UPI00391DD5E4
MVPTVSVTYSPTFAAPKAASLAVDAVGLAFKGNFTQAEELARRSGDPATIKLVELIYLRDRPNEAGYQRIMSFLDVAPNWPLTDALLRRAERSLHVNNEPTELVLGHFKRRPPTTAQGALAYARAFNAMGDRNSAQRYVRSAYYNSDIPSELEKQIVAEFGTMLNANDDKHRMWRLVYARDSNAAVRAARRLPVEYQKAAAVAQELLHLKPGADKQYAKLPAALREQPAMKYALVLFYRSNKDYAKARAILAAIPGDASVMGNPEAWWVERRIVARHLLGKDHRDAVRIGYQIAKSHGLTRGEKALEGEFLAGWIALRYLRDPETGLKHFQRLGEVAESRSEKARAGYWSGRALEAMGQKAKAKTHYRAASQYTTVYYGQLARERIGLGMSPEAIPAGEASESARAAVEKDEVVRAFRLLAEAGRKDDLQMFLGSFASRFTSVDQMNAAASVVWSVGGTQMAVRLAKAAAARNIDIDAWSYPVRALPEWRKIGKPVEAPLVYALARQESEFNPKAGSKVGAQGLMQIMPGTAKMITRQYKLDYQDGILTRDPAFNVMLGAAHLGDLIGNHGGSYVLALVSYNAGPRRSREWIAEYGDFRTGEIDPVDWVESIPFQETRQYVQKVMQNLHIYRSRLAPKTVQPMTVDLARGSTVDTMVVSTIDPAQDGGTACDGSSITDLLSCD